MAVLALPRRESSAIEVAADPNGLALASDSLYIADAAASRIIAADGKLVAQLPGDGTHDFVRGIAAAPDGALYATTRHSMFRITPDGQAIGQAIEVNSAPTLYRLGVTCRGRAVYATQFAKHADGHAYAGSVVKIANGRLTTIAGGFAKPVGLAWIGNALWVTDAETSAVVAITEGDVGHVHVVARIAARPDSICAYRQDSALMTAYDPNAARGCVLRMWPDGRSREIASGPWQPRGIASDGDRIYVSLRRQGRLLVLA